MSPSKRCGFSHQDAFRCRTKQLVRESRTPCSYGGLACGPPFALLPSPTSEQTWATCPNALHFAWSCWLCYLRMPGPSVSSLSIRLPGKQLRPGSISDSSWQPSAFLTLFTSERALPPSLLLSSVGLRKHMPGNPAHIMSRHIKAAIRWMNAQITLLRQWKAAP
jgi:hypothetical protein